MTSISVLQGTVLSRTSSVFLTQTEREKELAVMAGQLIMSLYLTGVAWKSGIAIFANSLFFFSIKLSFVTLSAIDSRVFCGTSTQNSAILCSRTLSSRPAIPGLHFIADLLLETVQATASTLSIVIALAKYSLQ